MKVLSITLFFSAQSITGFTLKTNVFSNQVHYYQHIHDSDQQKKTKALQQWQVANIITSTRTISALAAEVETEPEAMAQEGDWAAYVDEDNTGLIYYFNRKTGESLWTPPTETFPPVKKKSSLDKLFNAFQNSNTNGATTLDEPKSVVEKSTSENKEGKEIKSSSFSGSALAAEDEIEPEALAQEGDWAAYVDEDNTGMIYYFNCKTGESLWTPPTETFPPVKKKSSLDKLFNVFQKSNAKVASNTNGASNTDGASNTNGAINTNGATTLDEPKSVVEESSNENREVEQTKSSSFFGDFFTTKASEKKDTKSTQPKEVVEQRKQDEQPLKDKSISRIPSITLPTFTKSFQMDTKESIEEETVVEEKAPVQKQKAKQEQTKEKQEPQEEEKKKQQTIEFPTMTLPTFTNPFQTKKSPVVAPIKLEIESGYKVLPHPEKVSWGGEDAVFVQERTFGVFDGVSGADKIDGYPLYSITLAKCMKESIKEYVKENNEISKAQLFKFLSEAKEYADENATGASTAIVATLGTDNYLRVLNIGDCSTVVVRDSKIVSRSRDNVHFFGCPYQLAVDSPDTTSDSTQMNVEIIPGDIILMGSDGVFDNLDEPALIEAVESVPPKAPLMAKSVAKMSRKVSLDTEAKTPYAKEAKKNRVEEYASGLGGKVDDISCVVLRVS